MSCRLLVIVSKCWSIQVRRDVQHCVARWHYTRMFLPSVFLSASLHLLRCPRRVLLS